MTSFAKSLSSSPIQAASPKPAFEAAHSGETPNPEIRPSNMVSKDQPKPQLKPSPALTHGTDREIFNAAWEDEARKARREAFKAEREPQMTTNRTRAFTRAVNR